MNFNRPKTFFLLVIVACLLATYTTGRANPLFQDRIYSEDFEDGQAQGWELESGWQIINDGGNKVLSGQGHVWARSNQTCSDCALSFRLKLIKGAIHLVYRMNDSGRYFISFNSSGSNLNKQYWPNTFQNGIKGKTIRHQLNTWHQVEIQANGSRLTFKVDGKTEWTYDDPKPLSEGSFAFETLDDSRAYLDDVVVSSGSASTEVTPQIKETPFTKPATSLTWVRTGGPLGGLGYDVRMLPGKTSTIFVSDAWAGIFKSMDGGSNWFPSNTGITARTGGTGDAIPIFSVTVDPIQPNTIWVGTQNILGIFKSTNGGESWQKMVNGVSERDGITFRGFTVDPKNNDIVYAAAEISSWSGGRPGRNGREFDLTRGVVYKTMDGGRNWKAVWRGENLARYIWIDPRNTNVLYISTGIFDREANNSDPIKGIPGGEGILKSTDGGKTWKRVNNGLKNLYVGTLFMHPTNPNILLAGTGNIQYAENSGVYLTTDGGTNWVHVLRDQIINSVEIAVSNPSIVYAGSDKKIFQSEDGGKNWKLVSGSQENGWGPPGIRAGFPIDFQADPQNSDRIFANAYGGGNFLSVDGGKTWSDASRGYTGAQVRAVVVAPGQPARVFAAARSGIFVSSDGGSSWQGLNNPPVASMEWNAVAVDPKSGQHILGSTNWNNILINSTDGGKNWTNVKSLQDSRVGWRVIAFAPSNPNFIYAGSAGYYSAGQFDYAQPGKGIFVSRDGGKSWSSANDSLSQNAHVASLAIDPHDPQIVFAATENHGLLKTGDGGKNWQVVKGGLPGLSASFAAINPSNSDNIFAGFRGRSLYISTDGGQTWKRSMKGIVPEASISSIVFDPSDPNHKVYASDIFSGVYRSTDGGNSWTLINNGLTMRSINSLAISDDGLHLYAATEGGGVYRLDLDQKPPL
jgi:photosystem II stability/assembly factor-like uncharacterized protein